MISYIPQLSRFVFIGQSTAFRRRSAAIAEVYTGQPTPSIDTYDIKTVDEMVAHRK